MLGGLLQPAAFFLVLNDYALNVVLEHLVFLSACPQDTVEEALGNVAVLSGKVHGSRSAEQKRLYVLQELLWLLLLRLIHVDRRTRWTAVLSYFRVILLLRLRLLFF